MEAFNDISVLELVSRWQKVWGSTAHCSDHMFHLNVAFDDWITMCDIRRLQ